MSSFRRAKPVSGLYLLCTLIMLMGSGCVKRYNSDPVKVTDQDYRTTFPELLAGGKDDPFALKANWESVDRACNVRRAAIVQEADALTTRRRAIIALFTGVATGLALSTTIYNTVDETPNRKVTAVLGLATGLGATPTFFFLGADEREKDVRGTLNRIDAQREALLDKLANYHQVVANFDTTRRAQEKAEAAMKRASEELKNAGGGATAAQQQAVKDTTAAFEAADKALDEVRITYKSVQSSFSTDLFRLSNTCR